MQVGLCLGEVWHSPYTRRHFVSSWEELYNWYGIHNLGTNGASFGEIVRHRGRNNVTVEGLYTIREDFTLAWLQLTKNVIVTATYQVQFVLQNNEHKQHSVFPPVYLLWHSSRCWLFWTVLFYSSYLIKNTLKLGYHDFRGHWTYEGDQRN